MKRFISNVKWLFIALIAMIVPTVLFAQDGTVSEGTDYSSIFATFGALVAATPFVMELIKKIIPSITNSSLATQIVSWVIGILLTMFGWLFNLGFLADIEWWVALIYGLGVSLAANGIFDTGLIEWIISLFTKKKTA